MTRFFIIFLLVFCISRGFTQQRFEAGESITYGIYYHLMGVWVGAGEVTFSVHDDRFLGRDCFRFMGVGTTYQRYDWFFKVRDTYTAYADKRDLRPYRFARDVYEGGFYFNEENVFNHAKQEVYSILKVKEKPMKLDTFELKPQSYDVLSLIYYSRSIDFSSVTVGEKIPIRMVIDRETHDLFIRFLGTEVYDHDDFGEVECWVFSPLLVEGAIFRPGEGMKVYVSKDENRIPIYIESEIRVGSIRSEIKSYRGLKYPFMP